MPCETIHCWSFTTLVGAFLDLALAYLLLCGASLAFFTAKFLSIFGLRLPCSCHGGLFGNPNGGRGRCLQGLLVEGAPARIASIRASEKSRFPFVSSEGHCFDVRLVRDGMNEGSSSGSPSSSSLSSSSAIRESERRVVSNLGGSEPDLNEGKWNVESRRQRSGVRRRRRGVVSGNGKVSSFASSDAHQLLLEGSVGSAYSIREAGKGVSEEMPENLVFSNCTSVVQGTLPCTRLNGLLNRTQEAEVGDSPLPDKLLNCEQHLLCSDGNGANTIRILEQALKEEQVAHAALYLELEKERSAAATAADEAMAMILRLQKEKAVVEMEARQYQRMIEEKSAYDEEEMDILKEIIIRREREKHVLEKEVDSYRKVLLSHEKNGRLQDDLQEEGIHTELMAYPLFGSSEDPISMLHRLGQSLDEKEMVQRAAHNTEPTASSLVHMGDDPIIMLRQIGKSLDKKDMVEDINGSPDNKALIFKQNGFPLLDKKSLSAHWNEGAGFLGPEDVQSGENMEKHDIHMSVCHDECNLEFQEKGMVSVDVFPSTVQDLRTITDGNGFIYDSEGHREHGLSMNACCLFDDKQREIVGKSGIQFPYDGTNDNCCINDADANHEETDYDHSRDILESSLHDIHVIDDKFNPYKVSNAVETGQLIGNAVPVPITQGDARPHVASKRSMIDCITCPSCTTHSELNIRRSLSDASRSSQSTTDTCGKTLLPNLRRHSMSTVDNEKSKLESEVGWLRERLKTIQAAREKLNLSVDNRERENFQFQLLEEIACQLQEIRQLTELRKSGRQTSLPPLSSKVNAKKRRCRSLSSGLHGST